MRALVVRKEPTLTSLDAEVEEDLDTVVAEDLDAASLGVHDRPTLPVPPPPFESGVRLGAVVISVTGASVDVVTADLTRDPRSESYAERPRAALVVRRSGIHPVRRS